MSHFDDLTKSFDVWRGSWLEQYRQHQRLPPVLARQFSKFLGCPDYYEHDTPGEERHKVRYVSPTRASRNDDGEFTLTAYEYNSLMEEIDFQDDGYFYFGLRVTLEHGPNTFPKEPFWFLFRGKFNVDHFDIWVQRSGELFRISDQSDDQSEKLYEHLLSLLKEELAETPIERRREPNRIGFAFRPAEA